jgi:hypothetical protein
MPFAQKYSGSLTATRMFQHKAATTRYLLQRPEPAGLSD